MNLPKTSSRLAYQDTLNSTEPEHSEREVLSSKVHKYTLPNTEVCLREHQANFGLIQQQILDKICITLESTVQDLIKRIGS